MVWTLNVQYDDGREEHYGVADEWDIVAAVNNQADGHWLLVDGPEGQKYVINLRGVRELVLSAPVGVMA